MWHLPVMKKNWHAAMVRDQEQPCNTACNQQLCRGEEEGGSVWDGLDV